MIPILIAVMLMLVAPPVMDNVAHQQPDSPLYGVQQVGEQMELAAGLKTNSDIAKERINEYAYMAQKGKDDTQLLTDASNYLRLAKKYSESKAEEAVSYRGAVLKAVSESASVPKISRDRVKALLRTYSESGFNISATGVPMPPQAPANCWWDPYPIDGNIMDDIYKLNSHDIHPPNPHGATVRYAPPGPTVGPVDPADYTVVKWQTVGGTVWRLICYTSGNSGGPAPYQPPIEIVR